MCKTGSGSITLGGNNSYTGGTTVNSGTLSVAGPIGPASQYPGIVTVNGGVLALTSNTVINVTPISPAITINPGGTLITAGGMTVSNTGTFTLNGGTVNNVGGDVIVGNNDTDGTMIVHAGSFYSNGGNLLFAYGPPGGAGTATYIQDGGSFTYVTPANAQFTVCNNSGSESAFVHYHGWNDDHRWGEWLCP